MPTADECGHECRCEEPCPFMDTKAERNAESRAEERAELADRRAGR